jgi:myo-inositol-1(or 4)-monophosphatase
MNDAEPAITVVGGGAEVVQRLFGAPLERFDKGAGDFATTAEFESEAAMLAVLGRERPADPRGVAGAGGQATGPDAAMTFARSHADRGMIWVRVGSESPPP